MSTFPASATVGPEKLELEWSDLTVILAICRAWSLPEAGAFCYVRRNNKRNSI